MTKKIWKAFGSYKKYVILCIFTTFFEAASYLAIPTFMAHIFDFGLANKDSSYVIRTGAIMITLALSAMAIGLLGNYASSLCAQGLGFNLRESLFEHIMNFSSQDIDDFTTSSLITRLNSDVNSIQTAIIQIMRMLFSGTWRIIIALILAFFINAKLTLILIAGIIVFFLCLMLIFGLTMPWFPILQQETDKLNLVTQENIMAQRVVKTFIREDHEETKFNTPNTKLVNIMEHAYGKMLSIMPASTLVMNGMITAVLWFGGMDVGIGNMGFGSLTTFLSYSIQVSSSFFLLTLVSGQLGKAATCIKRIYEVIDYKSAIEDSKHQTHQLVKTGKIEFENISLKYSENTSIYALSEINIAISAGLFVGIIGSTGSGKSSLINLIPRLYDASEGVIRIDGIDIHKYSLNNLRASVATVSQDNVLFSGTIRENIKWGNPNATNEEIITVCKAAQADAFITKLPKGYDTWVEQGGSNFSGGQRQRLCIARALIKNAKILLMDDCTNALDTITEMKIRKALQRDYSQMTTLLISQKISSVKDTDMIIVFDNGKISGIGNHEFLLNENQIYREIYNSQTKEVSSL